MTDRKAFEEGLILGLVSFPFNSKPEPTAYSYNGVILPKLPEWDKETYPYAVIGSPAGLICVAFSTKPAYYNTTQLGGCIDFEIGTEMIQYNLSWDKKRWVYVITNPDTWDENSSYGEGVWTNTAIYKDDGTLYLAASEPIPVYE